jgi:glutamate-5-semialdehyde dehydrogenase
MEVTDLVRQMGVRARSAARQLAVIPTETKNRALLSGAYALTSSVSEILDANSKDLVEGERQCLTHAALDRLRLNESRVFKMAQSLRDVAVLPDPVGEIIREWERPNGLRISKRRIPIGVIGMIYESRPNVTSDAASLCLKTGNAVILRGGSESFHSNRAIAGALRRGCLTAGLPEDVIQWIPSTDRVAVKALAELKAYVDLIIPRGGKSLIETVTSLARMPVIKHYDGVCHVFVDRTADLKMATEIVVNAKCQRPGVCNAMETLLVHSDIADRFIQECGAALLAAGVEIRGDKKTKQLLGAQVKDATEEDWYAEYLDLILAIRVVPDLDAAIEHIEFYGSHHSDAIVSMDSSAAEEFLNRVDSAAVFWNASTRFNDGGEFGFGAEIGISTDRLHARGPMALEELTTYKYVVRGVGQVRS